ncbi:MAG TPA: SUMF1/EgtB/PvdO family nonheme iron enzyme [Acetobacteraceae bacterium]|nr:SUMF1/EgtB/PvdO family nonheme iron enzyme [Acetobacteraceae bacterium]
MTLVDTNVLLDLVTDDPDWADWPVWQRDAAGLRGDLVIDDVVYAECAYPVSAGNANQRPMQRQPGELPMRFATIEALDAVLNDARLTVAAMPRAPLFLASSACNTCSATIRSHSRRGFCGVRHATCRRARTASSTSRFRYFACDDGYANTSPVGKFKPNGFGLYEMLGNVWQWTADCYYNSHSGAPSDGAAWKTGGCGTRVLRGGSWNVLPRDLRASVRDWVVAEVRVNDAGFRLARN